MTKARVFSQLRRLSKLRAMSATELARRVRYSAELAIERRQHQRGQLAPPDRLRAALVNDLRGDNWQDQLLASRAKHATRFFSSVAERDSMRRLFATAYQREHAATMAEAAQVRLHQFEFFGQTFTYPDTIEWQCDPVTGRRWPALYHADMPVHGGDVGSGDVKHVWELSRQQFVIDLGKAWFLDRSADDLAALRRLIRSWIAGNPYATGVNWSCALEPAFRVFSWLWAYYLTSEDLDEQFHVEWLEALYDHGRFIERHLELYSSPYNHLIAEAASLYMLGRCFPEFRDAGRWAATGRSLMEERLPQQFYADGGSVEQSMFYHHATVGFYLLAAILGRATGDELSPPLWEAIERGLDFSMKLSQPDGKTPTIGGADDGKPIRMEHLPFWDFRPYQAIGAVLFKRPDFKQVAGRFPEDALWLLGPSGLAAFESIDAHPPRETSTALPSSGYYILRSDWSERADYVCFDCGEQAAGMRTDGVPNSMHGHADCLSIVAWLNGRRVLVDSGLYAYNCGGAWEAHFRETAAHNTAKVDGRDQATHLRSMAWTHSYRATIEGWHAQGQQAWVAGSHDGYARGPAGVVHRRAVWLRPDSYLLIHDEFVGSGKHELTVTYQFAPGTLELLDGTSVLFDHAVDLAWTGTDRWTATLASGGCEPGDGWIAPSLGIRQEAPRVTLSCTSERRRTSLLTIVAARHALTTRIAFEASNEGIGTLGLVSGADYIDCVAAPEIAGDTPLETDARLVVCRVDRRHNIESHRMGGSHVKISENALRRLADMRLCVATRL